MCRVGHGWKIVVILFVLLVSTSAGRSRSRRRCGKRDRNAFRLVTGHQHLKGHHPWIVSLERRHGRTWTAQCTGTLLSKRWVITSASCTEDMSQNLENWRVVAGDHYRTYRECSEQALGVKERFSLKEKFRGSSVFDAAMIQTDGKFSTNTHFVQFICLPPNIPNLKDYDSCSIPGWHRKTNSLLKQLGPLTVLAEEHVDDSLSWYSATILGDSECSVEYSKLGQIEVSPILAHAKKICIVKTENGQSGTTKVSEHDGIYHRCNEDLGGPLICEKDGHSYLLGVISYNTGKCGYDHDVFIQMHHYLPWIKDVINEVKEKEKRKKVKVVHKKPSYIPC